MTFNTPPRPARARKSARAPLIGLIGVLLARSVSGQQPVPVGAGSYASLPPASEGDGPQEMLKKTIYVLPGEKRPIPTNDWWTDLLVSKYAGDLWAYPFVVSANENGIRITRPNEWSEDGSRMEVRHSLRIEGAVVPRATPEVTALSTFDGKTFDEGWKTKGAAFGAGPVAGSIEGQSPVAGFKGAGFASSFHGGDGGTGTLSSPGFTLQKKYIHFLVAGGNHPDQTCVNLLVDNKVVKSATGENSEHLQWVTWDVSPWRGRPARIEVVDAIGGGWAHIMVDAIMLADDEKPPAGGGNSFSPADARALRWGDWTLTFRMAQSADQLMDVTLGRGLPYVWLEFKQVSPKIVLEEGAECFTGSGAPAQFPTTSDQLVVEQGGQVYGILAPPGTKFEKENNAITVTLGQGYPLLTVCAPRDRNSLSQFAESAGAIPRDSRVDWTYSPEKAEVRTHWTLQTDAVRGSNHSVWQGWIPHHLRRTKHALKLSGPTYATPRGQMKTALGTAFDIAFTFRGILPILPVPDVAGFDRQRMMGYIDEFAKKQGYGGDTYWGGKDVQVNAQYLLMARMMDHPAVPKLQERLHGAMADWFTYTPGEPEHFFAAYPNWKALVGFNESYWSYQFTDQHFHYGYFTISTALLGLQEPEFISGYGEMARLVSKEYANADRADLNFPFMRTFDFWEGHSYAGGFSSPGGNNQESSSEAIQSWAGLFLLGQALGDEKMIGAGAFGYASETEAIREYWFDAEVENFPDAYKHSVASILFNGGMAYATYFSGDPCWIHGIQWLPTWPFLDYLIEDPAWGKQELHGAIAERKVKEGSDTLKSMGPALGNVVLGFAAWADPDWAAKQLDELWAANDPVAHNSDVGGLSYYFTHAMRTLGQRRWDIHTVPPTGAAYQDSAGRVRYIVLNMRDALQLGSVYQNDKRIGHLALPPRQLTSATQLLPAGSDRGGVMGFWPADGATNASRFLDEVQVLMNEPVDPSSAGPLAIEGPGITGAAAETGAPSPSIAFKLQGRIQPGASYRVTMKTPSGSSASAAFRVEPQPPLALTDAVPPLNGVGVSEALSRVELEFNGVMRGASLAGARIMGPGGVSLTPIGLRDGRRVAFVLNGRLQPNQSYEVIIPAGASTVSGQSLGRELRYLFSTTPETCPPNVFTESFVGAGHSQDTEMISDLRNAESPHGGKFAMKLSAGEKDASIYFFNGPGDQGDRRRPVDLRAYDAIELWMKGDADSVWVKVGHPVFDKAFAQSRLDGIGAEYRVFHLNLPENREQINTLLALSVPAGRTVFLDDVRYVKLERKQPKP